MMNTRLIKLITIISISSLIIIVGGIIFLENNTSYNNFYYDKDSNSMFKDYSTYEKNYQLFVLSSSTDIEIYFPENISQYQFTNLEFYYNDNLIEADYEIISIKEQSINLRINEYFKEFNKIRVKYKDKDIFLYTGYYCFEYLDEIEMPKEPSIFLLEKHSLVQDITYKMTLKLNTHLDDDTLKVIIPKQVLDDNVLKSNNLKFNNNIYTHIIELKENELENNQLSRISMDVILIMNSFEEPSKKDIILKTNIPFELD